MLNNQGFSVLAVSLFLTLISGIAEGADIFVRNGVVHIIGKIEAGDDARFRSVVLDQIRRPSGQPVERVRIYSPGGNLKAALGIGDQVSALQLDTWVPSVFIPNRNNVTNTDLLRGRRTCTVGDKSVTFDPTTGEGDAGCQCASACFVIWATGATREGDLVGVHRPAFDAAEFAGLRQIGQRRNMRHCFNLPAPIC